MEKEFHGVFKFGVGIATDIAQEALDEVREMLDKMPIFGKRYTTKESEDELKIYVDLAGVKKEDIDLSLYEHAFEVRAKRYYPTEREYKIFGELPTYVKHEEAKAAYKDGILEITAPKLKGRKVSIE
ncbi:MAG: Hsp20/alpha crystallin family protein [Candidatus Aenigmarchaeota archaeon]|nr:Hsp20/alpha crystallin family protein [Candidatus Aenigmarchaeota archaeon]